MFYSQFILAKKGPLGTIWIAAHLERKLRKNQVTDTDIGVSVDSILFPEVPIALRLSSHLLLGVVRIYSRKVNYLFHDCSEALLKVKQAFRSSAVDLPPEESTAPYHSITLPETFHLDDFELPDSVLDGDYVDHHVSTKEQITLQDTMDATGFSTLQYGSDERFGDGNVSQIGLEFDEDLFLDKQLSNHDASIALIPDERAVHQGQTSFSVPVTEMDIDDGQDHFVKEISAKASKHFSELSNNHDGQFFPSMIDLKKNDVSSHWKGYDAHTPDLNEVFFPNDHIEVPPGTPSQIGVGTTADEVPSSDLTECAHAPSTPGLVEETFSANIRESPAFSPQQKPSPSVNGEGVKPENSGLRLECLDSTAYNAFVEGEITAPEETREEYRQKIVNDLQDNNTCNEETEKPDDCKFNDNGGVVLSKVAQMEGMASYGSCKEAMNSRNLIRDITDPLVEDVHHCLNNNVSLASKDIHLRSCTSQVNQANALSSEDGALAENVPEVSLEEAGLPSQTQVTEKIQHYSESSLEVQGKGSDMAITTIADLEVHEKLGTTITESIQCVTIAEENQLDQLNCSSTLEFAEPEKMLSPPCDIDQANDLGQITAEKTIAESDGSVNRITGLSGRKRRLMESASVLQNGSSAKISGRPQRKRNNDYIPDDDDLLASILVGRRTPLLKIGPTPPVPKTSLKSLRVMKRKVLLDDASVLHADAIRKQLLNTEDIRRIRKKAPCTRPEIWMIQKSSLEDEIFSEPIIAGISADLHDLHTRRYDSETSHHNSHSDPAKEFDLSRNLEVVREENDKEKDDHSSLMLENVDSERERPSGESASAEGQSCKVMGECDVQEHLHSANDLTYLDPFRNDTPHTVLTRETNEQDVRECEITRADLIADEIQQSVDRPVQNGDELSEMNDKSLHLTENACLEDLSVAGGEPEGRSIDCNAFDAANLNGPQDVCDAAKSVNGEKEPSAVIWDANSSLEDTTMKDSEAAKITMTGHECIDEREGRSGAEADGSQKILHNVENPLPDAFFPERPELVSVSPTQPNADVENVPSAVGENSGFHEFSVEGDRVVESTPMDLTAAKECSDFCSAIDGNDTEFLNVDDEVEYDEADNDVPNPQEARSLENSGWSSRTRGVARYLQNLFDEESGCGRKIVAMDNLIAGKTRKEASRMFFETLVLKTKDFIHVEQENPFDCISIKPRARLIKSEF